MNDEFHLRGEQFEEIAADADVAIVEATMTFSAAGETEDNRFKWLVATEDEEWRLVESRGIRNDSAGESDSESDTEAEPEPDPEIPDAVHEYMIDNDVQLYDGSLADRTGTESVTIDVGAGNQALAFDPPVIRIDAGTEVVWKWTGEGGAHNVVSTDSPEEFSNEDVTDEAGHTWWYTFEQTGTYFYYCQPHKPIGMHGAIIVE